MKQNKLEFNQIVDNIMSTEMKRQKEARSEVIKQNGSCLTCKHTKSQAGIFLICAAKNKKVREYNYCDRWQSELESDPKKD